MWYKFMVNRSMPDCTLPEKIDGMEMEVDVR